jgi:hypothetical protein
VLCLLDLAVAGLLLMKNLLRFQVWIDCILGVVPSLVYRCIQHGSLLVLLNPIAELLARE